MYLLLGVAGPGHVLLPGRERRADRVQARHERAVAEHVEHLLPDARHDVHVRHDVGRVAELDADVRDRASRSGPCVNGIT